jgi:tRNA (cytidine/uridine-2'-O-)-methyltransferase
MFAVVLIAPEIPPNTGNVIRLTANTATELHLVEPLGYRMGAIASSNARVLDYHEYARVRVHRDFASCKFRSRLRTAAAGTTHSRPTATQSLYEARFTPGDVLVFGCESRGLPEALLAEFPAGKSTGIPDAPGLVRSLNLSNAVAIGVYEAWRQQGFRLEGVTRICGLFRSDAQRAHEEPQLVIAIDDPLLIRLPGPVSAVKIHVQQKWGDLTPDCSERRRRIFSRATDRPANRIRRQRRASRVDSRQGARFGSGE